MKRLSIILILAVAVIAAIAAISNYQAAATTAPGTASNNERVAGLVGQLESADAAARANAATALAGIDSDEVHTALLANLADTDPTAGYNTAIALGRSQSATVRDSLVAELGNPDPLVRQRAALALGQMRAPEAVPALAAALDDSASAMPAAEALAKINDTAAQNALLVALSDKELTTRRHAAMAAIEQADPVVVQNLLGRALASDNLFLRNNAMMLRDLMSAAS